METSIKTLTAKSRLTPKSWGLKTPLIPNNSK
jgi:hypothetical protein